MKDPLDTAARSVLMSKVRASGNRSTEGRVETALVMAGIGGWIKHPKDIVGTPDFYFASQRLAVFVDGCFWHGCPVCKRNMPTARADFWRAKIDSNVKRDKRQRTRLRRAGYHVMCIREHELKEDGWLRRLEVMMSKANSSE